MSVRTEPRDLSQQLQQTLTIPADVMAAAGQQQAAPVGAPAAGTELVPAEHALHEANTFNNTNEHHPLERTVCVNIRASLADLCLKSQAATWAPPSAEATKSIFQQARALNLSNRATPPPSPGSSAQRSGQRQRRLSSLPSPSSLTLLRALQPATPSRTLR